MRHYHERGKRSSRDQSYTPESLLSAPIALVLIRILVKSVVEETGAIDELVEGEEADADTTPSAAAVADAASSSAWYFSRWSFKKAELRKALLQA